MERARRNFGKFVWEKKFYAANAGHNSLAACSRLFLHPSAAQVWPRRRQSSASPSMSLSIPVSYHRASTPHHRLQARSERRRQLLQVQEKMQGDLIALGYFYAELKVGTPPQTFSLIVDTGSSVTAIPCTGCRDCGPHTNPRFKPESSLTFRQAPCGGSLYCTSCVRGVCGYRVSYQEGSSYSGFLARDVIRLGVSGACVAVESFPFGCSTEETGLFTSQQADGIMGLGTSRRHADQSNPTVLEALVEQRLVEDVFSLCIGALRGTLTFGMPQLAPPLGAGGAAPREPASLFWTRVVESTYYGVEVTAIMLGEQAPRPTSLPSSAATRCTQAATPCTEAATLGPCAPRRSAPPRCPPPPSSTRARPSCTCTRRYAEYVSQGVR